MLKKIWEIAGAIWRLFSKKPPVKPGVTVVGVNVVMENGKKFRVTTYSDGRIERVEIADDDPTNVNGFLDDINRKP